MKLLHIPHIEDLVFQGHAIQAFDTLNQLAEDMIGNGSSHLKVSTKYDGAPAIVFGINPENNRFFLGTKSVFNKGIPKIAYTAEDIDTHYGSKPDLAKKLKLAFASLVDMYSGEGTPEGVYQADIMFTSDSIEIDEHITRFTPNTITYSIRNDSCFQPELYTADLGLVVHTRYVGETMAEMAATTDVPHNMFSSINIFFIDPRVKTENFFLTEEQYFTIVEAMTFAEQSWRIITDCTILDRHGKFLTMFANQCVRLGEGLGSIGMYRAFLRNRNETALCEEAAQKLVEFNAIFAIHRHLEFVKRVLIKTLETVSMFAHHVGEKQTNGEGFVATYHGVPVKLVNRLEFSRYNFMNKRFEEKANVN